MMGSRQMSAMNYPLFPLSQRPKDAASANQRRSITDNEDLGLVVAGITVVGVHGGTLCIMYPTHTAKFPVKENLTLDALNPSSVQHHTEVPCLSLSFSSSSLDGA